MKSSAYDVAVIGGGPAGLAAALAADSSGASVLLIEREGRLGGILKQCIHDGFGLIRFNEKLSGPEYAHRFTSELENTKIAVSTLTFVTDIEKQDSGFRLMLVSGDGITQVDCKSIVLACGCRERTSRQIGIHGRHCAGVFTAGTAQYYTNILGKMPLKRCVILGSGDIGLIMARRLTLEGGEVVGVYEAKPVPSGLRRNIYQCLDDFDIPLHLSKTVTRIIGEQRVTAVEIADVDGNMTPIDSTEEIVECDALILSVGLIPENELAESLGIPLDRRTNGPVADQNCMTELPGVFCCGNALHVNDLVDYVSETGEVAGRAAARWAMSDSTAYVIAASEPQSHASKQFAQIIPGSGIMYVVPQKLSFGENGKVDEPVTMYFRATQQMGKTKLTVTAGGKEVYKRTYQTLRPPEMERVKVKLDGVIVPDGKVELQLQSIDDK